MSTACAQFFIAFILVTSNYADVSKSASTMKTTTMHRSPALKDCGLGYRNITPGGGGGIPDVPWHVGVYWKSTIPPHIICGGSILSPFLVLTSAYCLFDEDRKKFISADDFSVGVGKRTVEYAKKDIPETKIIEVNKIFAKTDFMGSDNYYASDIALLELKEGIQFSDNIMPVCVNWDPTTENPPASVGKVSSLGGTEEENDKPSISVLFVEDTLYLSKEECYKKHLSQEFLHYILQSDKICADYVNGTMNSRTLAGGGLAFKDGNQYFIYGIVSFTPLSENNTWTSAAYTKIYSHLLWMKQIFKEVQERRKNQGCDIPAAVSGRKCVVKCDELRCYSDGIASPNSELVCECDAKHGLGSNSNSAICRKGKWFPAIPTCVRLCNPLKSTSLDFTQCTLARTRVDCTKAARPGTVVTLKCKPNYIAEESALVVRSVTCTSGGTWDSALYKCRPNCGLGYTNVAKRSIKPLLSNGVVARDHEVPWHVALYRFHEGVQDFICGGSILSSFLVITAAHCVYDEDNKKFFDADEFSIGVGKRTNKYANKDFPETKIIKVSKIFAQNDFYGSDNYYALDIALLELKEGIKFSSNIMPVCVNWAPTMENPPTLVGKIAGWGRTEIGGSSSDVLRVGDMPYLTKQECRKYVSQIFIRYILQNDKFCAGSVNGTSAEGGDSGGGLAFKDGNQYFIYGIVSFKEFISGIKSSVTSFTKIYSYLPWMDQIYRDVKGRREY